MRGRRQSREYQEEKEDKDWARRYILDPLTAPEPSQVDGPGTSFFNPRRSLSLNCRPTGKVPVANRPRRNSSSGPTPRQPSPPRRPPVTIHHPKPISPGIRHSSLPPTEWASADVILSRGRNKPTGNSNSNSNSNSNNANSQLTRGRSTRRQSITATSQNQPAAIVQPASTAKSQIAQKLQTYVRPSTADRPPLSSSSARSATVANQPPVAAAATVQQRPTNKRGRSRSLTSIIRIPSQSLANLKIPTTFLGSNLASKIQSTNENFVRTKPSKPDSLFPQVKQPTLRRSTVQISDSYKNSQTDVQSEHDRDREHEQSPLLPNKPPLDFTSRFPRIGTTDSSSRSSSIRTQRSGRKPPQTHHTQGTAEILSEILADKTNSVNNRANILPTTAANANTPLPVAPTTTSPFSFRTAPMMAQQPTRSSASSFVAGGGADNMSVHSTSKSKSPEKVHHHNHNHTSSSAASHRERSDASKDKRPPSTTRSTRSGGGGSSRRHHRSSSRPLPDTIDTLDNTGVGPSYHHGGPYDATLASVNRYKKTAPLEAVKHSNREALKATPKEYIYDSLRKHVPLQGTASVPAGHADMAGRVMKYEEGADLMREPDAPGGAYKRYDFIKYHPDDLKGKGEPSFTIERTIKEDRTRLSRNRASSYGAYELQDRSRKQQKQPLLSKEPQVSTRRQSFNEYRRLASPSPSHSSGSSNHRQALSRAEQTSFEPAGGSSGVRRSGSQRLSDGLKRRFGSLHRK